VHFGTIMVVNLALGMITPALRREPVRRAQVAGTSIDKMMRYLPVFIGVIFACLMVITYVPGSR
jgi:TRAP-type C4-dicarboxylate transport system permease large subunit